MNNRKVLIMMKEGVIKKYVKDLKGLLNEIEEIGFEPKAYKGFPNEKMVIFLFGRLFSFLFLKTSL